MNLKKILLASIIVVPLLSCSDIKNPTAKQKTTQIPIATTEATAAPTAEVLVIIPHRVASGTSHSCVLLENKSVQCVGSGAAAQIGSTSSSLSSVTVAGFSGEVAALYSGTNHNCAIITTGDIECWGEGTHGELGGSTNSATPVAISGLALPATELAMGSGFSCALLKNKSVACWGQNSNGELGNGTTTASTTPVAVTGMGSGVKSISAGEASLCAVLDTGKVSCWGKGDLGQLGQGSATSSNVPIEVVSLTGVEKLSLGSSHACAALADKTMKCWGSGDYGQLGTGTTASSTSPVAATAFTQEITNVFTSGDRTLVSTSTNEILGVGQNNYGQLGNGATASTAVTSPVVVTGLASPENLSGGENHSCAVTSGNTFKCWGRNDQGQLGDGTTTDAATPILASGINIVALPAATAVPTTAVPTAAPATISDTTAPTAGSSIAFSNIAGAAVTVTWDIASDNTSAAANLEYKLVHATDSTLIDTLAEADAISGADLFMNWTANTLTQNITGLTEGTHFFAVLVKDGAANKAIYTLNSHIISDLTPPVASAGGSCSGSSNTDGYSGRFLNCSWGNWSDNQTIAANMLYKIVKAATSAEIDTVAKAEAITGADIAMNWEKPASNRKIISGLTPSTTVYFALLGKDAAGNKAIKNISATTSKLYIQVSSATQVYDGNLGGVVGADQKCMTLFQKGSSNVSTNATYKALIMASTRNLTTDWVLAPNASYRLSNGGTMTDATDSQGKFVTTFTDPVTSVAGRVWSGINTDYTMSDSCNDWSSNSNGQNGRRGEGLSTTSSTAISSGNSTCDTLNRLVCIEQ